MLLSSLTRIPWFFFLCFPLVVIGNVQLYGVNYSLRQGPDWEGDVTKRCKSYDQAVSELTQLTTITSRVRVYTTVDCDTAAVMLRAANQVGMELWLGIWVGEDPAIF